MSATDMMCKVIIFVFLSALTCQLSAEQLSLTNKNERVNDLIKSWTSAGIFKWSGRKGDPMVLVKQIKGSDESELFSSSKSIHRMLAMTETSKPIQLIVAVKARGIAGKSEIRIGASMYGINPNSNTVFLSDEMPNIPLNDLIKSLGECDRASPK